jgi:hypothetical protein
VRSNPITGAAPKDIIIFVCARESEIEKGSQSHTAAPCGRKEIDSLPVGCRFRSFAWLQWLAKLHTHVYICASSSLFGFALGRNGDVSRTKAPGLHNMYVHVNLFLFAPQRESAADLIKI